MIKKLFLILYCGLPLFSRAQNIEQVLSVAVDKLESDPQFAHAIISIDIVDGKTGKLIYEKNAQTGLAPASCQKIVTSCAAFELLGKDFRYKTYIGKDPSSVDINKYDAGCLFIIGDGDPTLGSWRWKSTSGTEIFSKISASLKKQHLLSFSENLIIEDSRYGISPLPDGWVWQDIGNYYGAGCFGFNWHENQFDIGLQPGDKPGQSTTISFVKPFLGAVDINNGITTGKAGSGDSGYIYSSPYSNIIFTKGTIPLQKEPFVISGSMPNPSNVFKNDLMAYLLKNNISIKGSSYSAIESSLHNIPLHKTMNIVDSILSASLDSINYWFLKKSVNLFGEAFVKTIAYEKTNNGSTDTGIAIIKDFWNKKGIDKSSLNIIDGSGLSPANRITTNALVKIMQYAKGQPWFNSFYDALPEMNAIKMKDGYIGGVRSYTGYIKSRSGAEYTFSFIVNNFDGNPGMVREKMWKVLDLLK